MSSTTATTAITAITFGTATAITTFTTFTVAASAMREQVLPILADLLRREAVEEDWTALAVSLVTNDTERPDTAAVDAADAARADAGAAIREGHEEVRKFRTYSDEEEAAIEKLRVLNAAGRDAEVAFQFAIAFYLFVTEPWQTAPRWAEFADRQSWREGKNSDVFVEGVWLKGDRSTNFSVVMAGRIAEVIRVLPLERGEKPPFKLTADAVSFGRYLREVALVEAGRTA